MNKNRPQEGGFWMPSYAFAKFLSNHQICLPKGFRLWYAEPGGFLPTIWGF